MSVAQTSDQTPDYPLNISMEAFADMAKILNALGNEDALAIFIYSREGISSSKDAIRVLGLTQKRFYSRLKDLIDTNLIEKEEGEYRHTALGKIICDMGLSMEKLLLNKDKLTILNQLSKAKNLTMEEKQDLMDMFSINVGSSSDEVSLISSFEELVSITVKLIQNSESMMALATQYIDNRVIDEGFRAYERGVKGRVMVSQLDQITRTMKVLLQLLANPGQMNSFLKFLKSAGLQIRRIQLPYTFIIIDEKECIIEIKDQITDIFKFALHIKNEDLSKKLLEVFDSFWENAEDLKEKLQL